MRQAYDIFNTFGRDPESLKNITMGFSVALSGKNMIDVNEAFNDWLMQKSSMPTPSEILRLTEEKQKLRLSRTNPQTGPWYQVLRDPDTKELIEERLYTEQLSAVEIRNKYGRDLKISYWREGL